MNFKSPLGPLFWLIQTCGCWIFFSESVRSPRQRTPCSAGHVHWKAAWQLPLWVTSPRVALNPGFCFSFGSLGIGKRGTETSLLWYLKFIVFITIGSRSGEVIFVIQWKSYWNSTVNSSPPLPVQPMA